MFGPLKIAPSILSADFTRLYEAVEICERGGADYVHVDVMDGHFVPNLTIGPPVVKSLKAATKLPLDVHLMITNADDTVDQYLDAGADLITVHVEASTHLDRTLNRIKERGAQCGVTLNPSTPVSAIEPVIEVVDMVLLMSVNPGFAAQPFIPYVVDKVAAVAAMAKAHDVNPLIEVDGGINPTTAKLVKDAGADVLVAGNAVFGTPDPVAAIKELKAI